MFDAVRNNKRVVQVFLALITLPFAFFGVDSYVRSAGGEGEVAEVAGVAITPQQFQQALRDKQDRLRNATGGKFDPAILNTPEARKAVLEDLISQRLLMTEAVKQKLAVSDEAVRRAISGIDAFNVDGKFSVDRYEALLRGQGLTIAGFEAQIRQDLTLQQLLSGVTQSGFVSRTTAERLLALQQETREVQEVLLSIDSLLPKVKLADDAAQKYYEANGKAFEIPEQLKAEYLTLSMDSIAGHLSVTDSELKAAYETNKSRYQQPEERRASHILITAEKDDKAAARARAEALLAELKKAPATFAELAKKNSRDPGSAAKGGDLGFFGRGMMVKPFEDSVFALKEGELSEVVESDFGFHIIKLTGTRAATVKPFAEVKSELEAELRKASAARKFAEAAEAFTNLVYEQSDSLKPAAEKFKLTVSQSGWLLRNAPAASSPLANAKLQAALFSEEAIKNQRNTEAVEVAPNTLIAARVLEHKPAARQPFEAVKASIESQLKREEALKLAAQDGAARLEALKKGEDKLSWSPAKKVSRLDPRQIPPAAIDPVFKLNADKLPAYTGVELPGSGYGLFKLVARDAGPKIDDARRKGMLQQLGNFAVQEETTAYLAALRQRHKVKINEAVLNAESK